MNGSQRYVNTSQSPTVEYPSKLSPIGSSTQLIMPPSERIVRQAYALTR